MALAFNEQLLKMQIYHKNTQSTTISVNKHKLNKNEAIYTKNALKVATYNAQYCCYTKISMNQNKETTLYISST